MSLRVGSLVYATDSGLGLLARSFYRAGILTDALVVRHAHFQTHSDWYPDSDQTLIRPFNLRLARQFCESLDVFLAFETPHDWTLLPFCHDKGVKTVLMPMYECMPRQLPYQPDLFLCPSLLDQQYYPDRSVYLPVPVEVPWRQRDRAEVFVHNAGHGGLRGRNGTGQLLDAMPHVKSPIKLILRSQKALPWDVTDTRVECHVGTVPDEELWTKGDVFVFPDKFNGLSLPLQEARAAGMLVMSSNRFPANTWLPTEPLIPLAGTTRACVSPRCNEFEEAIVHPLAIARAIDDWYGRDISAYSLAGKAWAEANSWERLGPKYRQVLEELCA